MVSLAVLKWKKLTNQSCLSCDLCMPYFSHLFNLITPFLSPRMICHYRLFDFIGSLSIIPFELSLPLSVCLSTYNLFYCLEHVIVWKTLVVELSPLSYEVYPIEDKLLHTISRKKKWNNSSQHHCSWKPQVSRQGCHFQGFKKCYNQPSVTFRVKQEGWWWTS